MPTIEEQIAQLEASIAVCVAYGGEVPVSGPTGT